MGGRFAATALDPVILPGYAYDGAGAHEATGELTVSLVDGSNSGEVRAHYTDEIHTYEITWVNFTGREAYQDGGVEFDVDVWGDSGNGSNALPRVHAHALAAGTASFRVDGEVQGDPSNRFATIPAMLVITEGQYRDPESHRVYAMDGRTQYSPERPGDALVSRIGAQATLMLVTSRGDLFRLVEFNAVQITSS